MSNTGFLYRTYSKKTWPFYNGDEKTLSKTMDNHYAKEWREKHSGYFEEIVINLPAWETVTVNIPIYNDDKWYKEDTDFEKEVLSDIKIDAKSRIVCNKILQEYYATSLGFFVKRKWVTWKKMHTKNMEVLQLMKDVIMWLVRYEPIKLDYEIWTWARKKRVEFDWDIAEDLIDKTYIVNNKKYKTNIYWVYTRKLRKAMFYNTTWLYDFYGGHELQYFQRVFDLNYWASNYMCSSRDSWKSMLGMFMTAMPMFKSPTSKREIADKWSLKVHYYVRQNAVISNYSQKLKEFFYNLLVETYKLSKEAANQIVTWRETAGTMTLNMANDNRTFEFVSEWGVSRRWERSGRITLDESNYLKNYDDVLATAIGTGAPVISQISTISQDSKATTFYKTWVENMIKMRQAKPIEEIIHSIWIKYWFNKITSRADYEKMMEDWTFDKARAEYFKLRPFFAMKSTLDDVEYITQEEKDNKIQQAIDSSWYEAMLAEYYCELSPETAAINYRPNIIWSDKLPARFEKIFAWYDEADSWDEATMVIWWVSNKILYIIWTYILPKREWERYAFMKETLDERAKKSILKPSLIVDVWRWPIYFRETSQHVPYADMWIKARSGKFEKIDAIQWVSFYAIWTDLLVEQIIKNELLDPDRLFFASTLPSKIEIKNPEWIIEVDWLFWQLDNYIHDWKWYTGKGRKPDDLVSAMLYCAYYAYVEAIKWDMILTAKWTTDYIETIDAKFQAKHAEMKSLVNKPRKTIRSMW